MSAFLRALNEAENLEATQFTILRAALEVAPAAQAAILLADDSGMRLTPGLSIGFQPAIAGASDWRLEPSQTLNFTEGRHLVLRADTENWDGMPALVGFWLSRGRSVTVSPICHAGRLVALLVRTVENRVPSDPSKNPTLLSLLEHSAIAMEKALALENFRRRREELPAVLDVVDEQRLVLERTLSINDEFTRMVLDGQGIGAVVATLGRIVDNPVVIVDRFFNLLEHYSTEDRDGLDNGHRFIITNGSCPSAVRYDPEVQAVMASLAKKRRPSRLMPLPRHGFDKPRVVAPIVVDQEIIGLISVLEGNHPLDVLDLVAVERAATAIALRLMKEQAAVEAKYKLKGDLIEALLTGSYGSDEEIILKRAAYLGIDLHVPHAVLVVGVEGSALSTRKETSEHEPLSPHAKVLAVLERACRRKLPEAVVTAKDDEIIILASFRPAAGTDGLFETRKIADSLHVEVPQWLPGITISLGIGGPCNILADYLQSYEQARCALDVIKASRLRGRILAFDQLGINGLLFDLHNRDKALRFMEDTVGGLLAYDERHHTQLAESVHRYLLHDRNIERAAQVLFVHPNTLRYRLQRAATILKTDLESSEAICNLHWATKVLYGLHSD